jgi:hypothetical protein
MILRTILEDLAKLQGSAMSFEAYCSSRHATTSIMPIVAQLSILKRKYHPKEHTFTDLHKGEFPAPHRV